MTPTTLEQDKARRAVRAHYGNIAETRAAEGCGCAPSCCSPEGRASAQGPESLGYDASEVAALPEGAEMGLGCGNPVALAALKPGETVLDLGSGGGIDCFLASERVGPTGAVIGVDMTASMISKARENAAKGGYRNVEFRLGEIEALPVADGTVDAILSNCVINLSPDKPRVFREAYRVLKKGGRLSIADIVATADIPPELAEDLAALVGCVAGAAKVDDLRAMLREAGFADPQIAIKEASRKQINAWTASGKAGDFVASALIEAVK